MTKKLWVTAAGHDEQGSFCDTGSQTHYENASALTTEIQIRAAGNRGEEVIVVDAPADADDSYGVGQRFNLWSSEEDGQGTDTPTKHRVGGH